MVEEAVQQAGGRAPLLGEEGWAARVAQVRDTEMAKLLFKPSSDEVG